MKKELGCFVVGDSTKCTGCRACELACFTVHNRESNHVGKTVGTVSVPVAPRLFLTKFEEGCMPIQCKHCEDAPCLNACTKGAISRIDHQVIVDAEKCIGCKDCMQACPFGAIALLPYAKDGKLVAQPWERKRRFSLPSAISVPGLKAVRPASASVRTRLFVWWIRKRNGKKRTLRRQKLCS